LFPVVTECLPQGTSTLLGCTFKKRFCQICRDLAKFADLWPILHRIGQICRALAKLGKLDEKRLNLNKDKAKS